MPQSMTGRVFLQEGSLSRELQDMVWVVSKNRGKPDVSSWVDEEQLRLDHWLLIGEAHSSCANVAEGRFVWDKFARSGLRFATTELDYSDLERRITSFLHDEITYEAW